MALPSLRAPGASGGSELVRSVAFESPMGRLGGMFGLSMLF